MEDYLTTKKEGIKNPDGRWKITDKHDILEYIGEECQYGVCNICLDFDYKKGGFALVRSIKSYQYGTLTEHIKSAHHRKNVTDAAF